MEGYCSTGQSPQRAVVPVEEEEEEEEEEEDDDGDLHYLYYTTVPFRICFLWISQT
jgi:hypothetical protein